MNFLYAYKNSVTVQLSYIFNTPSPHFPSLIMHGNLHNLLIKVFVYEMIRCANARMYSLPDESVALFRNLCRNF